MSLFRKAPSAREVARTQQRDLRGAQRDLDRELQVLDRQEQQITAEIKRLASKGQNASAKTMARELVRVRAQRERIVLTKSKLSGVSARTTTMAANQSMVHAMGGATKAMGKMNAATPTAKMVGTAQEFSKQSEMMDMKQEMIDDVLDGGEEEELEADSVVSQVFDEIGLDLSGQLKSAPTSEPRARGAASAARSRQEEEDLDAVIAKLGAV
eukprot:m51a1_g3043 hypothetical protein (212) ;mRNA; r:935318-936193